MKKILALILVALMTVSMFAACGAKTETAASASSDAAASAPAAEEEAPATDTPAEEAAGVDCSSCHGDAHKPGDDNPHGY